MRLFLAVVIIYFALQPEVAMWLTENIFTSGVKYILGKLFIMLFIAYSYVLSIDCLIKVFCNLFGKHKIRWSCIFFLLCLPLIGVPLVFCYVHWLVNPVVNFIQLYYGDLAAIGTFLLFFILFGILYPLLYCFKERTWVKGLTFIKDEPFVIKAIWFIQQLVLFVVAVLEQMSGVDFLG